MSEFIVSQQENARLALKSMFPNRLESCPVASLVLAREHLRDAHEKATRKYDSDHMNKGYQGAMILLGTLVDAFNEELAHRDKAYSAYCEEAR